MTDEYAQLKAGGDDSQAAWKASLGLGSDAPKLTLHSLSINSASAPNGAVSIDLEKDREQLAKNPLIIKEGVEYNVSIKFSVAAGTLSGLRYRHVVRRAGVKVDKLEQTIGTYGANSEPYVRQFETEESESGVLAKSGLYCVSSRITGEDGDVLTDWTWSFKIGKDW